MSDEFKPDRKKTVPIVARILDDGTIIEMIYDPARKETALVIGAGGEVSVVESVEVEGRSLIPFSPDNNLIRHRAVLLPSMPEPYEDERALRTSIQSFIHRFVDLSPVFEQIATEYVLLSWVYDAFNEVPYLRLQGDYGTGKTRALLILGSLMYRSFFASGASTVSPIFHTLDSFRGTLVFDEADFRMSDEKADLVKILNNGTVRGIPVLRTIMNQKKEFNPAAFQVFGPKIVATRGTFDDRALESRFITEVMGGRKLRDDIPINLPNHFADEALHLRNQLLTFRFKRWHSIKLDPSLADPTLEPRHNQVLVPLLSITEDEDLRERMRESVRLLGQTLLAERSVSIEGELLAIVLKLLDENPDGSLPLKLVREAFVDAHGAEFDRTITTRYIAAILRRSLAIRVMKSMGIMVIPRGEESRIREIGKRFGLDHREPDPSREQGTKGESEEARLPTGPMI